MWGAASASAVACGIDPGQSGAAASETARAAPEPSLATPLALESIPAVAAVRLTAEQRRGQAVYDAFCWTCHGRYGHGDGPAARGFRTELPELSRVASTTPAEEIVEHMQEGPEGVAAERSPPVWHALGLDEVRPAVAYIGTFASPDARGNPAAGRLIYATYCVHCHGNRGAGDGRLARGLSRPPSDLRSLGVPGRANLVFTRLKAGTTLQHGVFMPRWGRVFTDQQLRDVIAFLPVLAANR